MNVLVDTSVWSLALRRRGRGEAEAPAVAALADLIRDGRALLIGPIRQELLSGVRSAAQFATLRQRLRPFPDLPLETADYEEAAALWNRCRGRGVQGSAVDLLICAVAVRRELAVLSTDQDFARYAPIVGLRLQGP